MPSPSATPLVPYRPRPTAEILDLLLDALETTLPEHCTRRYEVPLSLSQLTKTEGRSSSTLVRLERRSLLHILATIAVTSTGGNTYDVQCTITNGPSCQYSYSLPGNTAVPPIQAPIVATTLTRFLLDELERRVGRRCLRSSAISLPASRPKGPRPNGSPDESPS